MPRHRRRVSTVALLHGKWSRLAFRSRASVNACSSGSWRTALLVSFAAVTVLAALCRSTRGAVIECMGASWREGP